MSSLKSVLRQFFFLFFGWVGSFFPRASKQSNTMCLFRQVQDLEKQLAHARQQLNHLRSASADGTLPESNNFYISPQHITSDSHRSKRHKPTIVQDFSRARSNVRRYGRGIFRPPQALQSTASEISTSSIPELPLKHVGDELLRHYHTSIHVTFPIIHWQSFIQKYEEVYREGSLQHAPRIWGALLFLVFGFGALRHSIKDGQTYLETSKNLIDIWAIDFDLDHVRCALLSSVFLVEMNLKSAAWAWLGFAVRIAQDIGLHSDIGTWSATELEMRRRVWWSVYACDR